MKVFLKSAVAITSIALAANSFAAPKTNANVSAAERAKIESVVHDYILQNPEVVIQAVQNFQRKQYQEAEQTVKQTQKIAGNYATQLFHEANDPSIGSPTAKVTVTEFFDYQCPHCIDMAPTIVEIMKKNPEVRIVFKDFPIRGPMSEFAAKAALAANKQGKYYELSHGLLTANKQLTEDVVYDIAKNVGIDVDKLKTDMNDKSVTDQLDNTMKLGQSLKLFGTPAFFIGKTDSNTNISYVPGRMDTNQLQAAIDKASK